MVGSISIYSFGGSETFFGVTLLETEQKNYRTRWTHRRPQYSEVRSELYRLDRLMIPFVVFMKRCYYSNKITLRGVYNMKIGRSVYVCSSHRNSVHAAMNMSSLISLILGKCKGAHKIRVRIVLNSVTSEKRETYINSYIPKI